MRVSSISETKNNLSALLRLVRAGETVLIVDRGKPVARLEPVDNRDDLDARLARLERAGVIRRGTGDIREALRLPAAKLLPGNENAAVDAVLEERRTGW